MNSYRTHHCAQLRKPDIGQRVVLSGWVDARRDHGGLVFVDLRDREGVTQIVFDPQQIPESHDLRSEYVIRVEGEVAPRPEGTVNPKLVTGEIEVKAAQLCALNKSETPPYPLDEENVNEDLRLQYRYLDLRRRPMIANLRMRHRVTKIIRDYFDEQGFLEIETPMLFKSTPEGAREYLVPSRTNPGLFYALPQSPQQFKQLLMVAGVEKYFQIARCFRDEDLRADRQPEFTQVDVEMSFIGREDIYRVIEGMLKCIWKGAINHDLQIPLPRIAYQDAMNDFGADKPDRRFGIQLKDFTDTFRSSGFKVFAGAVASGGVVKAINAKGLACVTQGQIDLLTEQAKTMGAKGLAWIKVEGGAWKSPIVKFFSEAEKSALTERLVIEEGDLILFAADKWSAACEVLGKLRLTVAEMLQKMGKLNIPKDVFDFFWVVDFPLITFDPETQKYKATHHPFTAPVDEDIPLLDREPTKVRGQHYDLVVNGIELAGGSIRIHQADVQRKVFEDVLKIPKETAESRFGYLIKALGYGAPPHGGIAPGLDRIVALVCGTENIREVIAFPKNARAQDLMTGAPAEVEPRQLRELRIQTEGRRPQ
ncbi:MAG: aspartate--tRNA ligase [Verrucomicrobia bacterium]|nr:aspartate--tRNA ligase [Verrucomicrobiota bacterium]